jgi:hypothetical protein
MNHNQQVKSFNPDPKAKNRIKFTSARQRAKQVSSDVYRTYKRRTGVVTSAASREERVHHIDQFHNSSSRKKRKTVFSSGEDKAIITKTVTNLENEQEEDELELETSTTFQMELILARDRNASVLFQRLYNELMPLVGSLPEILHHSRKIITILLSYLLSPYSTPNEVSPENSWKSINDKRKRGLFLVNIVTTDVLHLMSVLARDLRHEIHPCVHDMILPRIINDLINPPTIISYPDMKQQRTLDITVVEAAFRTISYIFRYDTDAFLEEDIGDKTCDASPNTNQYNHGKRKSQGCLELMRKYYGSTLAHKAEFVRRLAAESFDPLVRNMKSNESRKKHKRRVIRSLGTSAA